MEPIILQMKKTCDASRKYLDHEEKFREMFVERYGHDFSDIDCDPIIDSFQGGSHYKNLKDLDKAVYEYCKIHPRI